MYTCVAVDGSVDGDGDVDVICYSLWFEQNCLACRVMKDEYGFGMQAEKV